jgi:hypothetical protein
MAAARSFGSHGLESLGREHAEALPRAHIVIREADLERLERRDTNAHGAVTFIGEGRLEFDPVVARALMQAKLPHARKRDLALGPLHGGDVLCGGVFDALECELNQGVLGAFLCRGRFTDLEPFLHVSVLILALGSFPI